MHSSFSQLPGRESARLSQSDWTLQAGSLSQQAGDARTFLWPLGVCVADISQALSFLERGHFQMSF